MQMLHDKDLAGLTYTPLMGIEAGTIPKEVMPLTVTNTTNGTYLLTLQILFQGFTLQMCLHTCEMINT